MAFGGSACIAKNVPACLLRYINDLGFRRMTPPTSDGAEPRTFGGFAQQRLAGELAGWSDPWGVRCREQSALDRGEP
jgi:hypothetical protein